jgi:threonylcarbamoyladenosine tRNA methylthiotransferase MtaB
LARLPGQFRIRLSSIEATEVTRELIDVMAEFADRICPHLHVCLQSGSDAVLRRMRRRWSARMFVDRCKLVQSVLDQPALTTDIIVGFPGETDEDYAATEAVVREVGFAKLHVFSFSARRGTPAAEMEDKVPAPVIKERFGRLLALGEETAVLFARQLVGQQVQVLLEGPGNDPHTMLGTACRYVSVQVPGTPEERGQLTGVSVNSFSGNNLQGVRL